MLRRHGNKFKHLAGLSYAGLAGSSAAFLLILAAMLFTPAASQPEASATENNSSTSTSTTENSPDISTYATTPTVGISLPASIDFDDVLPTLSGATTTATADLTITTSDSAGYSLYLYSSEGDNSLKSSNPANISTIDATAGDVGLTLSSLKPNTWGYNLGTSAPTDSTTYSAVPTDNSTPIQTKDTSATNSANDTYTLAFGAKVDSTIASGTYSNALTVAVVAEPGDIVINYDANGGYFNNDASQTTNTVSYLVEEVSTQTIEEPSLSADYDKTITVQNATSLIVSFSCSVGPVSRSNIYLYDGSQNIVAECISGMSTGEVGPTSSGTYVIPGDTISIVANYDRPEAAFQATITGYSITTTSGTQELAPTRPGYNFAGWHTDAAGTSGNDFVPNGNMTSGTTVYAKWEVLPTIQEFTLVQCQSLASDANYTVVDSRDGSDYTVRYINDACWMTQNLRLSGGRTLTPADSDVTSNWEFPSTPLEGSSGSYTDPQVTISSNTSYGGYYNFCAASAGDNCSDSDSSDSTNSICPAGWKLPTLDQFSGITNQRSAFSPVLSGYYDDGSLYDTGSSGYWWSATAGSSSYQFDLYYGGSSLYTYNDVKYLGFSVRCVRSS